MKFLKDFGALVAIVLAALGGAMSYGSLKADVTAHGIRLDRVEPAVNALTTDVAVIKAGVDRMESAMGTKPK